MTLIDPALLENLTDEQKEEALAAAAAAKRAEERAEQRAIERALAKKAEERQRESLLSSKNGALTNNTAKNPERKVVFLSKKQRNGTKKSEVSRARQ